MKKIIKIGIAITVFAWAFLVISCMEYDMYHIPELDEKDAHQNGVTQGVPQIETTEETTQNDESQNDESGNKGTGGNEAEGGDESEDGDPQGNDPHGNTADGLFLAGSSTPISGVNSLADAVAYVNTKPGDYHLVITGNETIPAVTLDNAHSHLTITSTEPVSITRSDTGPATTFFNVTNGTLVLDGKVTLNGGGVGSVLVIGAAGSFELNGNAKITGGNNIMAAGGGITVRGTFNMHGGEISGNTSAASGGGVYVIGDSANFTMMGGIITNNTTSGSGGGVFITSGAFNIVTPASTASIYGNTAATYPQVFDSGGTFTVNGVKEPNY